MVEDLSQGYRLSLRACFTFGRSMFERTKGTTIRLPKFRVIMTLELQRLENLEMESNSSGRDLFAVSFSTSDATINVTFTKD